MRHSKYKLLKFVYFKSEQTLICEVRHSFTKELATKAPIVLVEIINIKIDFYILFRKIKTFFILEL
jgi:hypothetical protein